MKIWFLSAYDQPKGQSPRTYEFALELTKRGHEVSFFTNSLCHFTKKDRLKLFELRRIERINNIRTIWVKTFPYKGNGFGRGINMLTNFLMILINGLISIQKPDIIICPSVPIFTGFCGYLLSIFHKVDFIYDVRDVWPDILVDIGALNKKSLVYFLFKKTEKLLYKKCKFISSTLPFLDNHVSNCGADPKKIFFIPNGLNTSKIDFTEKYDGGDSNNMNVYYIGGFSLDHDVENIIRAADLLQKSGDKRFKFTIIGDGVNKKKCIQLASSLNLNNIEFKPPVRKEIIYSVQSKADILLACIKDTKSYRFGLNLNKICTYLGSARPIVFSGNSPNDLVKESKGGISVEAENPQKLVEALVRISTLTRVERIKMGQKGREYAEKKLSILKLSDKMERMLLKALK